jgi:tetratricopeptide (TPR) repeat protein
MSFSRHPCLPSFPLLVLLVLLTGLCAGAAQADVYSDVAQLARDGKRVEALSTAQSYTEAHPRDPQMRFLLGVIQSESGNQELALKTFTLLTQEYPEIPEPYNNLAVLLAAQGQYDKAREALSMAVRANPEYATAHENLGDVYARLAQQAYARSLQLDAAHSGAAPKLALLRQLLSPAPNPGKSP